MRYEKWEYNASYLVVRIKLINYHEVLTHYRAVGEKSK